MELIDKAALVAEINRILNSYDPNEITSGRYALVRLRDFLDTLEMKEVDLEDDVDKILEANDWIFNKIDFYQFAKHFFELGLKAQKGETILSKVKGYLVRDKDDYTAIYAEKPHRGKTEWVNNSCLIIINDARLVPDIEFEDEPIKVELTLKKN